jgi:hypothetical protein
MKKKKKFCYYQKAGIAIVLYDSNHNVIEKLYMSDIMEEWFKTHGYVRDENYEINVDEKELQRADSKHF